MREFLLENRPCIFEAVCWGVACVELAIRVTQEQGAIELVALAQGH